MRVEISDELFEQLNTVKELEYIAGKGHTETVAFLLRHYKQTESIEAVIESKMSEIDKSITNGISNAFKQFFQNLLRGV